MKVINGNFGKQPDTEVSLADKLQLVFEELKSDGPGNFVIMVESGEGEMTTATDLPLTEVLYLIEMLKLSLLLDLGGENNATVH